MLLTVEQLKTWTDRSHVEAFLRRGIAEWHHIEYKSDLGKWKSDTHREFFKDITAFANANGGDIMVGVREPAEGLSAGDQAVGVDGDPDALAREWENRANSGAIDPKIPGLLFQAIAVGPGKCVLVVHIAACTSRPHLVVMGDRRYFWMRHSKQVLPMNSYDIRESVLSVQSFEQRALDLCAREERLAVAGLAASWAHPFLVLQAAPVPPPPDRLPVYSDRVRSGIQTGPRHRDAFDFTTGNKPLAMITGVRCSDAGPWDGSVRWYFDFHSDGFAQLLFPVMERQKCYGEDVWSMGEGSLWVFQGFAERLAQFVSITGVDSNFLMRCTLFGAGCYWKSAGSVFIPPSIVPLQWPNSIRQAGEPFENIATQWYEDLQCAYHMVPRNRK